MEAVVFGITPALVDFLRNAKCFLIRQSVDISHVLLRVTRISFAGHNLLFPGLNN